MQYKNDFITALLSEITLQRTYLDNEEVKTIYFGGGTPSILSIEELEKILQTVYSTYQISDSPEITLEANPDDITAEKLNQWKQTGITRFSIGVQSFFDEDLQWMNRVHTAKEAERCIQQVRKAGFENFSVDLIYGGPTLSDEHWQKNIKKVIALNIPHISCYALTVEPKTALEKMIRQHKKENVDSEKQAEHFLMLMNELSAAGYEHYEISNFAKPGYRSKHNSSYWQGKKYLGLGPSAHSFNGKSRQWNIANNALYIQSLKNNELNFEKEELSLTQRLNEYIMTSLRTIEGLDLNFVKEKFGITYSDKLQTIADNNKYNSKLLTLNSKLTLSNKGKLFADGITADLFF